MESITIEHILPFVEAHRYSGYFLLFIAMLLEGELFLIIAGMLAHLKAFDLGDVFWVAFLGVFLGNVMWYSIARKIGGKEYAQNIILKAEKIVLHFLPHFRERPFKSILFSKFIYGANRATVVVSGFLKVKFLLFLEAESIASIIWVLLYGTIGYLFGYVAIQMTHKAAYFALLILVFVVGFVLLRRYITSRYEHRQEEREKGITQENRE